MSADTRTSNLLVELFVEELPPKALKKLGDAFAEVLAVSLVSQELVDRNELARVSTFASPRRLALLVPKVQSRAQDKQVSLKLMPVSVALTADGQPTPALLKKLASVGADAAVLPQLKRQMDGKAEALFYDSLVPGVSLAVGLQKALDEAIAKLPIPKLMTYQPPSGELPGWSNVSFVRPAHGLVALHGSDVVPVSALGLHAGRETHGHRFEAQVDPIVLTHADHYAQQLREQGAVIASYTERREEIAEQLRQAAMAEGLALIDDHKDLLDEVTALVERPKVLLGRFEARFLEVPQECLILTMKANQKYFPLLDAQGRLTEKFLIVSNISPADASRVIEGNERVVRPRLADAKFFYDQDRKKTLASRVAGLDKVVYHGKLGSQGDRTVRVGAIAHAIVTQLRMATVPYSAEDKDHFDVLDSKVQQAARLAKTDLLTDMVGEFPELQGVMGGYYARHEGLRDGVAIAIEDHYKPRFAGDALPRNHTGTVLALADKLETLVGLFGIGQVPTGDKDPFALRRHALGVVRILREMKLPLAVDQLLDAACDRFSGVPSFDAAMAKVALNDFILDRLAGVLRDEGFSAREVDAVLAPPSGHTEAFLERLDRLTARLVAVRSFSALPESEPLASANKRVGNILKKAGGVVEPKIDGALLMEPAEAALADALTKVQPEADAAFERGDYRASLQALAVLKEPVDAFFEQVMVNVDDEKLRANRLGLLAALRAAMNRVADLSKLAA